MPSVKFTRTSDGVSIAYQVFGEGPAAIWPSAYWASNLTSQWARASYRDSMEMLARSVTLFRYDGRGSGLSQREPYDFSLDARVADLEAVADQAGPGPLAMIALGHACLGAIAFAARYPERVSRLVLRAPYPRGSELYEVSPAMKLVASLHDVTVEQWEFVTLTIAQRMLGHDSLEVAEVAETFRASMTPDGMLAFREATRRIDVSGMLANIRAPTLVFHDDEDAFTPLRISQEVAAAIPEAELRITRRGSSALSIEEIAAI